MAVEDGEFVKQFEAAISKNGLVSELRIKRGDGSLARLKFPTEQAGAFLIGIEQAVATLFEAQRKMAGGQDPRNVFPMAAKRIARIQGAAASDGTPMLSIVLDSGARLDFAIPREIIRELIQYLQDIDAAARQATGQLS